MKKLSHCLTVSLSIIMSVVFLAGCNELEVKTKQVPSSVNYDEKLLTYAELGGYKVTEEKVQTDLLTALTAFNPKKDSSRMASTKSFKLSKVSETTYKVPDDFCESRSIDCSNYDDIDFYVYDIEDESSGEKSFAITSNDRRVGEIIAVCNGTFEEDISDNPFMQIVAAGLENHILSTIEQWEEIKKSSEQRNAGSNTEIVTSGEYTYSDWNYHGGDILTNRVAWHQNSPFNDIIERFHDGDNPAGCGNVALAQIFAYHLWPKRCSEKQYREILDNYISTMCVDHELVQNTEEYWNGEYDWRLLNNGLLIPGKFSNSQEIISYLSDQKIYNEAYNLNEVKAFKIQAASLLYDIAENFSSVYNAGDIDTPPSTDTEIINLPGILNHFGYTSDSVQNYNFNKLKESIYNDCPVYCSGQGFRQTIQTSSGWWLWKQTKTSYSYKNDQGKNDGHAWIVNGWATLSCKAESKDNIKNITDDYLLCNPGWQNENYIGFYLEGIFDFRYGHRPVDYATVEEEKFWSHPDHKDNRSVVAKEYHEFYYSFLLQMVTNIQPE